MCRRTWSPPAQQPEPRCVLSWAAALTGPPLSKTGRSRGREAGAGAAESLSRP